MNDYYLQTSVIESDCLHRNELLNIDLIVWKIFSYNHILLFQKQMGEMKLQLENVIKENERLHSELKDAVEKQLEALPFATEVGNEIYTDDETVRNLQEQLQLANQEKTQTVELWQTVSQELDRLQKLYQEHMTEAQIHVVESQKQKDQLTNFQHLTKQLHVTNENMEMVSENIHLVHFYIN
uniref:Sodium channel and clathrin linker 1 n=1 Tax=Sus scrofa TaxID=9823 RepID=A0A8D1NH61_PIG